MKWDEALKVACPFCGAAAGAFCIAGTGLAGLPIPRRGHRSHRERVDARRAAELPSASR